MGNLELMKHWEQSSDKNFETMLYNFKGGQFTWSLYFGHLVLEKLFKALYAKLHADEPHAPRIHNLIVLAKRCNLIVDGDKAQKLTLINTFHIEARYEDQKQDFYKQCTKKFSKEQIENIKELREWLKQELTKE